MRFSGELAESTRHRVRDWIIGEKKAAMRARWRGRRIKIFEELVSSPSIVSMLFASASKAKVHRTRRIFVPSTRWKLSFDSSTENYLSSSSYFSEDVRVEGSTEDPRRSDLPLPLHGFLRSALWLGKWSFSLEKIRYFIAIIISMKRVSNIRELVPREEARRWIERIKTKMKKNK